MAERLAFRTCKAILSPVIGEVPGTKADFPALAARVWKDGNTVVLQDLFDDPRCFAACVHDDEGCFRESACYLAIHRIPRCAAVCISGGHSTPNIQPCRSQAVWASQADCRSWPPFANIPHSGPVVDTVLRTVPPPEPSAASPSSFFFPSFSRSAAASSRSCCPYAFAVRAACSF